MIDGKTLREYIRGERAKLKAMTFNEKRLYIWEYYKLHILGLIIVVGVSGAFINNVIINPRFIRWARRRFRYFHMVIVRRKRGHSTCHCTM